MTGLQSIAPKRHGDQLVPHHATRTFQSIRVLTIVVLTSMLADPTGEAYANDWPQWRGPTLDSTTPTRLSTDTAPAVKWRVDLGAGYGSLAVRDGVLYAMGYDRSAKRDVVYALDAKTGKEQWRHSYPAQLYDRQHAGGPAATPAVTDKHVLTLSRNADLYCLDRATGDVVWSKDLKAAFGASAPNWMFAGSVAIIDDLAFVDVGRLIAFDPATGKESWATQNYGSAYSTPTPLDVDGKRYIATFNKFGLVVVDPANRGREVAKHRWETSYGVNAATPVVIGNRIFITSGYNVGCAMLEFDGKSLRLLWESRELASQMATPVVHDQMIFGLNGSRLRCVDLSGRRQWDERGAGAGTLAVAGDQLVVVSDRGEVLLADATPKSFEPHWRVQALSSTCWTAPAVADGMIYVRDKEGHLAAVGW